MPMLFVLHKAPSSNQEMERALELAKPGDGLVLIQDAVFALRLQTGTAEIEKARKSGLSVYALRNDVKARGLAETSSVVMIDYDELVELMLIHERTLS